MAQTLLFQFWAVYGHHIQGIDAQILELSRAYIYSFKFCKIPQKEKRPVPYSFKAMQFADKTYLLVDGSRAWTKETDIQRISLEKVIRADATLAQSSKQQILTWIHHL